MFVKVPGFDPVGTLFVYDSAIRPAWTRGYRVPPTIADS